MKYFTILMLAVIVSATLIANLGYGNQVFAFLRYIPGRDLTGHFALYALLGFAVSSWISRPTVAATRSMRIRIIVVIAVLVTLEEFGQTVIPTRTYSLYDLAASLAGLFVGLIASTILVGPRGADVNDREHP